MRLLATQYTLSAQAFEIYFAGCKGPHCKNCHNPESWDAAKGDEVSASELFDLIKAKADSSGSLIKSIRLLGGEPLDQPSDELEELVLKLTKLRLPIWLFTKYEIFEVPFSMRMHCSYIKTGRYVEKLKSEGNVMHGIKLATKNQQVLRRGYDY